MVKFFKKILGTQHRRADVAEAPLSPTQIAAVLEHFPIGEKLRYYPEYQKDCALDTLILGYAIDGHFIYNPDDIHSGHGVLRLFTGDEHRLLESVQRFSLLIPNNPDDESKRDYVRRAELGTHGAFRRHNTITLVASGRSGVLANLDTTVRRVMPITDGVFAGHQAVMLDAVPDTLTLTDQRQRYRVNTALPASLSLRDGPTYACVVRDFAEESVRLEMTESDAELEALTEYRRLTLQFDLGSEGRPQSVAFDGNLYRRNGARLVMSLNGIYRDGELQPLDLVQTLEIKARLLRHPASQPPED